MPSLPSIRNLNIKIIFLTHFVFVALSTLGHWNVLGYLFYNFVFMLFLVWSIYHPESDEPIQMAIVVNGASVVLDILLLVFNYPSSNNIAAAEKFSAAMCILHLIIRPFSTIVLIRNLEERTGISSGLFAGPSDQSNYEDIDRNPQPTRSAYDFSSAQQI